MTELETVTEPTLHRPDSEPSHLMPQQVEHFLQQHPDFFQHREHLLMALSFPQVSGGTLSLAARQAELLRERIRVSEKNLHELHVHAHANEQRARSLHRIALTLLNATQPTAMLQTLREQLIIEFDLAGVLINIENHSALDAFSSEDAGWKTLHNINTPSIPRMNNELRELMVKHGLPETGSLAAIPLSFKALDANESKKSRGMLLLVKREPHGFSPDMGSLFLEHIGDLLSASLARYAAVPA